MMAKGDAAEPPPKRKIRQQLPLASGSGVKSILAGQPIKTVRPVSFVVRLKRVVQGVLYTLQQSVGFVLQLFGFCLAVLDGVRQRLLVLIGDDENDDEVDDDVDVGDEADTKRSSSNSVEKDIDDDDDDDATAPQLPRLPDSRRTAAAVQNPSKGAQGAVRTITVNGIKISSKNGDNALQPPDTAQSTPAADEVKPEIITLVKLVDSAEERKRRASLEYAQQQVLQRLQEIEDMEKGSAASREARDSRRRAQQSYAERKLEEIEQLEQSAKPNVPRSVAARPPPSTADLLRHASASTAASSSSILGKMGELFKQVSGGTAAAVTLPAQPTPPPPAEAPTVVKEAVVVKEEEQGPDAAFSAAVRSFGSKLLPPMSTQSLLGYAREIDLVPGTVVRAGEAVRVPPSDGDDAGTDAEAAAGFGPAEDVV